MRENFRLAYGGKPTKGKLTITHKIDGKVVSEETTEHEIVEVPVLILETELQRLQYEIQMWSFRTFGPHDRFRLAGILNHLCEEIVEYSDEENQTKEKGEELADIGILLLDLLAGIGIKDNLASILGPLFQVDHDLYVRMCFKHQVNLKRVWDRQMEGGRIKHVKSPTETEKEEKENQGSEESHA